MIDSLAHINLIKKNSPNLDFTVAPIPAEDSYTGKRGLPYASWGIGIADSSEHKAEAFKLVEFLMSQQANAQLSTLANGFPGNNTAEPDFSKSDPMFKTAFGIYKEGYPANEFVGLPKSEELMRTFDENLQLVLTGDLRLSSPPWGRAGSLVRPPIQGDTRWDPRTSTARSCPKPRRWRQSPRFHRREPGDDLLP
jgi:ABC-type glycerol-3-phosphate transport system substrate-binding protein